MNTDAIRAQFRRELWENKVSFLITPIVIAALVLVAVVCASFFAGAEIHNHRLHFSTSDNGVPLDVGVQVAADQPLVTVNGRNDAPMGHFDGLTSVNRDPQAFDGMIVGAMYANCALLYLVFSIVISAYSLRCLFDDRKNRDILFWRSMPVSETTNVLVKLAMILLVAPIIMLLLNLLVTLLSIVLGLIFFSCFGVNPGVLLSSVFNGQALYLPLQICYELMFALLMLLPVFGFAFLSSAWAKRSPFFVFASPAVLVLVDMLLHKFSGLSIGAMDFGLLYGKALSHTSAAFVLQQPFVFDSTMVLPLVTCVALGSAFIALALWLRNNRYEI